MSNRFHETDFYNLAENPGGEQLSDDLTIGKTEPTLVFPVLACFPVISFLGHFGTCIFNPTRTAKNGKYLRILSAIGLLYITVSAIMVFMPSLAATVVVADNTATITEAISIAWGVVIGEIVCAVLSLALWIAGVVFCFQAYDVTKQEYYAAVRRTQQRASMKNGKFN